MLSRQEPALTLSLYPVVSSLLYKRLQQRLYVLARIGMCRIQLQGPVVAVNRSAKVAHLR